MRETFHSLALGFLHFQQGRKFQLGLEVPTPIGNLSLLPMWCSWLADLIGIGSSNPVSDVPTNTLPAQQQQLLFRARVYIYPYPLYHLLLTLHKHNTFLSFQNLSPILELNFEWIWAGAWVRARLRCELEPLTCECNQVHLKSTRSISFGWFTFVTLEASL